MYRELIENLIKDHRWAKLQEPCPESKIAEAERYVGFAFPEELKNLLREADGDRWLLMSAEQIMQNVKLNREILADAFDDVQEFNEKVDRLSSLEVMAAEIITVIAFFLMEKRIHQQSISGNTRFLKFEKSQKIFLI